MMNAKFAEYSICGNKVTTRLVPLTCEGRHDKFVELPIHEPDESKADPVGFWLSLSDIERLQNSDLMKSYILWPILTDSVGLLADCEKPWSAHSYDLSIKELIFVELLEDLAELYKRVSDVRRYLEGFLRIGDKMEKAKHKLKNSFISEAMNWVQSTKDHNVYKKLESHEGIRARALQTFFMQYAFFLNLMAREYRTLIAKFWLHACEACEQISHSNKCLGNDAFVRGQYSQAVEAYSTAIRYSCDNHILFSNRALCFIRMGKYGKALNDGKKAVILRNEWPKGHYRFCEALFLLGETERAIAANEKAQELCKDRSEGTRDLIQQHDRFQKHLEEVAGMKVKKNSKKKATTEKRPATEPASDSKENKSAASPSSEDVPAKESASVSGLENIECPGNMTGQEPKKGKSKGKASESEKLRRSHVNTDSKAPELAVVPSPQMDEAMAYNMVKTLVPDGCKALNEQRFRNAKKIFSDILELVQNYWLVHEQGSQLTTLDHAVLKYGHATALLGIGQGMDLFGAAMTFEQLIRHPAYSKERFSCLAYYGLGNAYLRHHRFADALKAYVQAKDMIKYKMVPGILTWPTTTIVLEESRPKYLQARLEELIEECKFPPKPNAICRYDMCFGFGNIQIYFSDPDYKGFIRMICCQNCKVEFHLMCWKRLKTAKYPNKNDKDFLKHSCLTPDCTGFISYIVIYNSSAQVKCEFEDKTEKKKKESQKPIKHKCTSNKKTKLKPENKAERGLKRTLDSVAVNPPCENKEKPPETMISEPAVSNGYHVAWDPLLKHVYRKQELIRSGCPVVFPRFWESVVAWRIISQEQMEDLERNTSTQPSFSKMKNLLNHLYKLNDRVKTRIFLYLLHCHKEYISVELLEWVTIVDNKGLEAAQEFRELYEEALNSVNVDEVIDLWNVTYGSNIDLVLSYYVPKKLFTVLSLMDVTDFRCVIWFLEENKQIPSVAGLEKKLNKYFQEMDVPCGQVPKQPLEAFPNNCTKLKTKHKKKKRNQPKATYKVSGAVSTRSQEDDIFTEEYTLSLLDPYEPFLVPEYLRQDVREFEVLYESDEEVNDSAAVIRHTLYEYFSQILEEYGPLTLGDALLIGEYKAFPAETHMVVESAGGLKNFLLKSGKFALVDDLLSPVDFPFIDIEEEHPLNPKAKEFASMFSRPSSSHKDSNSNGGEGDCSDRHLDYPLLYKGLDDGTLPSTLFRNATTKPGSGLGDDAEDVNSIASSCSQSSAIEHDHLSTSIPLFQDKPCMEQSEQYDYIRPAKRLNNIQTAIVSVQVIIEVSQHEVNTDPLHPFETQQGDLLRMEKELIVLGDQLQEATDKYEHLQSRCQEEITELKGEIKCTIERNKITKQELAWFQQVYEQESKKWQLERKENQDKLKALKNNIKSTNEANEKCARSIEENKKQYEKYIDDFLKIHYSKFENDKSKVEKHMGKCEEKRLESTQRSIAAEVIVLENQRQGEILKLINKVSTAEQSISVLKAISNSGPASAQSLQQIGCLETLIKKLRQEMDTVKSQFDEKIDSVRKGLTSNTEGPGSESPPGAQMLGSQTGTNPAPGLPLACAKPNPEPAKSPVRKGAAQKRAQPIKDAKAPVLPNASVKPKNPAAASGHGTTSQDRIGNVQPPDTRQQSPAKPTLFDKIIEELHIIFPHYKSAQLASFIRDFRVHNNGTLTGFSHEEIISRVTEHILDYQAKSPPPSSPKQNMFPSGPAGYQPPQSPQPKQPWRVVTGGAKNKWQSANDSESYNDEPCIICHDDLTQFPVHRLDCGHCFHKHCIKKWLNTQSTCPTCREHALLPEDFPALSGRMRTV